MKKLLYIFIATFILISNSVVAQKTDVTIPAVTFKGKISYERKTNVHKQLEDMMKNSPGGASMMDQMKKNTPKYKTDLFELFFNEKYSVYKPAPNGITESKMMMGNSPSDRNIVFNDYERDSSVTEKKVFEKNYLIRDSLRKCEWKITEEFRKIAGYNCRRAETIIMDSIYVIAFYTDGITTMGGPEGFNGLPGMILGVVMPRLNTTYFATKIENYLPTEKELVAPTKGEKKSNAQLEKSLRESLKQWGAYLDRMLWYVFI
jgi:GLPGLI family protein